MNFATAPLPSESLTVFGLPVTLADETLHAVFSQYGTVRQCRMLDPSPGMPSRGALVEMATVEEAAWLVQHVHNNIPSGLQTPVTVQYTMATPTVNGPLVASLSAPSLPAMPPAPAAVPAAPETGFREGVQLAGTVKRWDDVKGFGFIVPDGGGPDVFVHVRELQDGDKLVNGSQVVFEATQDPSKGPGRFRAKSCKGAVQKDSYQGETTPANEKVFMTGLPLEITEESIVSVFSQYGQVASVKKLSTQPGKLDAAALVLMGSVQQAEWLVKNLNGNIPTGLTQPVPSEGCNRTSMAGLRQLASQA